MPIHLGSPTIVAAAADSSAPTPIPEEEEFYSSWSLFLVCLLLILSLWTSYYLQIKRIRAIHETVVSIVAGMVVGFIVRLAPGHLIREMLVSHTHPSSPTASFFSFLSRVTRVFFLCLSSRWRCPSEQKREGRESRPFRFDCHLSFPAVSDLKIDFQAHALLQPPPSTHHLKLWLRAEAGMSSRLCSRVQQE